MAFSRGNAWFYQVGDFVYLKCLAGLSRAIICSIIWGKKPGGMYEKVNLCFGDGGLAGWRRGRHYVCAFSGSGLPVSAPARQYLRDALGWAEYTVDLLQRRLVHERHPLLLFRPSIRLGPVLRLCSHLYCQSSGMVCSQVECVVPGTSPLLGAFSSNLPLLAQPPARPSL